MNPYVRHIAVPLGVALSLTATASAEQPKVWAVLAPHARLQPETPAPCAGAYCGLNALQDLWKRDALKRDPPLYMNADKVLADRANFQKQAERFGNPNASMVFNYDILGSGICVGSNTAGGFGLHTC